MRASDWWTDITTRHAGAGAASFKARGNMQAMIPAALFDTVLENCLENARKKKQRESDIHIIIELETEPTPALAIIDTGSAVSANAVDALFRAPVLQSRRGGLGIGLYQAFKQAEVLGYDLLLAINQPGMVRFDLRKRQDTAKT